MLDPGRQSKFFTVPDLLHVKGIKRLIPWVY